VQHDDLAGLQMERAERRLKLKLSSPASVAAFDLPSVALGWREWPKHLRGEKPREKVEL
jgi:hypothetical protein